MMKRCYPVLQPPGSDIALRTRAPATSLKHSQEFSCAYRFERIFNTNHQLEIPGRLAMSPEFHQEFLALLEREKVFHRGKELITSRVPMHTITSPGTFSYGMKISFEAKRADHFQRTQFVPKPGLEYDHWMEGEIAYWRLVEMEMSSLGSCAEWD